MPEQRSGRTKPKYQQIADDLRAKIYAGEWQTDARLPTKAELMEQYGVALNTVERAIEVLRGLGLVETFQGLGTFVRKPPEKQPGGEAADRERLVYLEARVARLEAQIMDIYANLGMRYQPEPAPKKAAETG